MGGLLPTLQQSETLRYLLVAVEIKFGVCLQVFKLHEGSGASSSYTNMNIDRHMNTYAYIYICTYENLIYVNIYI